MQLGELLRQAGRSFEEGTGHAALLSDPVVLKESARSLVVRCRVESAQAGTDSLILKQIKDDPARGFSEWASLQFLSTLPDVGQLVPAFCGGDATEGFYLLSDLGSVRNLEDILCGSNPEAVLPALTRLAQAMAQISGASQGLENEFDTIRSSLPHADQLGRHSEALVWLQGTEKLRGWFEALNCAPPCGLEASLQHIFNTYRCPGDFLAFTHGDPAPTNNFFRQQQAGLLDFEYGGFRHGLYDITAWQMLCPLPMNYVAAMRREFQREFASKCDVAGDEACFAPEWACLCAYRAVAILSWIGPSILVQDGPWAGNWTMRRAVFVAVSRLAEVCAGFGALMPLGEAAGKLVQGLRSRWPGFEQGEDLLPVWGEV